MIPMKWATTPLNVSEQRVLEQMIRAEQASYRKFIEVELRSLVREASELLSCEDKPDWGVVRLLLNNATGRATEIIGIEKRESE